MDVSTNIDLASAIALVGVLVTAIMAFAIAKVAWGHRGHERLARETGLPLLGKVPMEAVYAAIFPIGRVLARIGFSANAVSVASLGVAAGAGVLFATGHFGAGAAVAVPRATRMRSRSPARAAPRAASVRSSIRRSTGTSTRSSSAASPSSSAWRCGCSRCASPRSWAASW